MVDKNLRCIQIHISKTGGMAIRKALFNKEPDKFMHILPWHKGYHNLWEIFYTFVFVRNPFDRLLSAYSFSMDRQNPNAKSNRPFIVEMRKSNLSFEDFIMDIELWQDKSSRFKSMKKYFFHPETEEKFEYNFIGRYENLQEDFDKICRDIGVVPIKLKKVNKSNNREADYKKYYTDEMIEIVNRIYKWDLEYFNYEF